MTRSNRRHRTDHPPRAIRYNGTEYPSLNAAYRATGHHHRVLCRDGELIPDPAGDAMRASGPEGAARRIWRAARIIQYLSRAEAEGQDGAAAVVLRGRRMGLVRALHMYRERYGRGASEVLGEDEL